MLKCAGRIGAIHGRKPSCLPLHPQPIRVARPGRLGQTKKDLTGKDHERGPGQPVEVASQGRPPMAGASGGGGGEKTLFISLAFRRRLLTFALPIRKRVGPPRPGAGEKKKIFPFPLLVFPKGFLPLRSLPAGAGPKGFGESLARNVQ
jgi:hypothetical protein